MATEKQSESMYFHVMNVHSFFLVLKLIAPIHFPRNTFLPPQFGTKFNLPKISRKLPPQ